MRSRAHPFAAAAAAALLLSACSDAGQRGRKGPAPFTAFDALTVEQSGCYRGCPVFEVKIFADGRVRHSGPEFEFTGGAHASRIDRRALDSIAGALRTARLDDMRDRYRDRTDGCEYTYMDASTLSISLTRASGHRNKSVDRYTGCLGPRVPTERIGALIDAIDKVTGTAALLEQRKRLRPQNGETAGAAW
ncbi:DUF6438 domain-containing protein [uncultured Massilia sp.]|uniref:DUF6438 domain-containing protein n=1 Tax=uncultured Massilia sp. TaxID=169973 RepID=UPI002588D127|nr:DUF6438 domain-containing protein [uncultured Massilia sp.]